MINFKFNYFLYLVTPYLHESMHRKIIKSIQYKFNVQPKRTTIYLPASLSIKYPTREINDALKNLDYLINCYKNGVFYEDYFLLNHNGNSSERKSYQIVLTAENLSKLEFLKQVTGLSFSELASLSFY